MSAVLRLESGDWRLVGRMSRVGLGWAGSYALSYFVLCALDVCCLDTYSTVRFGCARARIEQKREKKVCMGKSILLAQAQYENVNQPIDLFHTDTQTDTKIETSSCHRMLPKLNE